jgi:hypothetical protein
MIVLEAINLERPWGRLVPDRPPRTEAEFETLAMVLRGVDALLAGRDPGEEFTERILRHPEVQRRLLEWTPPAGKTV